MWFDGIRQPNTLYVASVSRGKDSTAMLRAIQLMGWPLDAIVSVDIWFDDETPAELPPLVEFKDEWDAKVLERFGIPVTRLCATQNNGQKQTYCNIFYRNVSPERARERERERWRISQSGNWNKSRNIPHIRIPFPAWQLVYKSQNLGIYGFAHQANRYCTGELKKRAITSRKVLSTVSQREKGHGATENSRLECWAEFSEMPQNEGQKINIVHYIGIAADEPKRIARYIVKPDKVLPLVQIGWGEELCGLEATYMDMLSPTYSNSFRDGCWFCHNQGVGQLRDLRRNYPNLWAKLMVLDDESPVTFHADGHTVHDFDRRFQLEDDGLISADDRIFRWSMLDAELNYRLF